ncbi:hypothetical protein niasHT_032735 [Heterodera trifolii]|uniref:BTB domain-containing protein n=1 Tax=Heterodera trifolii TaxID=157864 RepID=A0ABD2IDL3_9BILA
MSKSVIDGIKLKLRTGEYADVHFLVGDGDGKELLSAHKLILKLASDVFEAMFRFDANKEQEENASANCPVVEVPDVGAAAFKVMLSFIYTDDLNELNGDNAIAVLYAAKKYNIPHLVCASLQIPISKLRNVFFAYAQARLFDLENYANDCLAYIDKNADILIKSEAFLQIDQNLLSENRRQMLGPALFKIRFPLFSQEEFSEKIVPSGILTTIEVMGVEQYHTNQNFCGISNGLLYPVQFPSHRRIWTFGTLLMDIEKVSEFAREEVESSRYSEKVYINGLPWQILAKIKTKMGSTDNEKSLGFYLLCDAPNEDSIWHCYVRSATFRIVSQKKVAENSIGKRIDRVFNKKNSWWGYSNFISFAELMDPSNGFYNKEEKVTLTIDVITVKDEKMEKISDPNKSEGTLSMEIEKVSEFGRELIGSERISETVTYIKGLPWKIWAEIEKKKGSTENEKWLGFYLWCDASNEENWSCKCSAIFRIVSRENSVPNYRRKFNDHVFDNKENTGWIYANFISFAELMDTSKGLRKFNDHVFDNKENTGWGYANFISFAELMDTNKGFYDQSEDKVTLEIDVTVKEAKAENKQN